MNTAPGVSTYAWTSQCEKEGCQERDRESPIGLKVVPSPGGARSASARSASAGSAGARPVDPGPVNPGLAGPSTTAAGTPKPDARQPIGKSGIVITEADLSRVNTKAGLIALLRERQIKLKGVLQVLRYDEELEALQIELVKLQRWVQTSGRRIAIILEGRDAAGKGGTIRRFIEHLNPRAMRVVALPKPTEEERGQWYFQRYAKQLPNAGRDRLLRPELVQPRRGRAGQRVLHPGRVRAVHAAGARVRAHALRGRGQHHQVLVLDLASEEQLARFKSRRVNPLKQWKLSPDRRAGAGALGLLHAVQGADVQPHPHLLQPVGHRPGEQQEARRGSRASATS